MSAAIPNKTENYTFVQMPEGWPQVNMPACYIKQWYRFSMEPSAGNTEQSPAEQPENLP